MKRILYVLAIVMTIATSARGQINVPDVVAPNDPIVAGCDCIIPKNGTQQIIWTTDVTSKYLVVEGGKKLHVWAGSGEHFIDAVVVTSTYTEMVVFVPDPKAPDDITKAKPQKIKVTDAMTVDRYTKKYRVDGTPTPPPGPGPNPPGPTPNPNPPGPTPTGFAAEVQAWMKALPPGAYSKTIAQKLAMNYLSVGSQGSDPARNGGWNLESFRVKTKELNTNTLTTAEIAAWTPFLKSLAEYQAKQFAARGLTVNDVAKIAALWTESGEAINAAAY